MEHSDGDGKPGRRKKKRGAVAPSGAEASADVERLLGIAMGCMGISREDFCRCTPSEFYAAYEAWIEMRQLEERGSWERMRMQCVCSLQPYSKKRLTARDVMQFPWEEEGEAASAKPEPPLSREELLDRYRKARERAGLK